LHVVASIAAVTCVVVRYIVPSNTSGPVWKFDVSPIWNAHATCRRFALAGVICVAAEARVPR
jgi:hypothetical protein